MGFGVGQRTGFWWLKETHLGCPPESHLFFDVKNLNSRSPVIPFVLCLMVTEVNWFLTGCRVSYFLSTVNPQPKSRRKNGFTVKSPAKEKKER